MPGPRIGSSVIEAVFCSSSGGGGDRMTTERLILKHASASRPSGEWNDDDYDVLADGVVVGRIMRSAARQSDSHGYGRWPMATTKTARRRTATRRRARPLAAFAKSWRRE